MDEQLPWFSTLLGDHGVRYWVESGTLLTTYRSGTLTEYDDDIDVAMWASDLGTLDALVPEIEARGYATQIRSYHGHPYKYQFLPTGSGGVSSDRRPIDLMVFRKAEGHAWTGQSRLRREFPVPGLATALDLLSPLAERYARSAAGRIEITSFPKRSLTEVLTLWLPLKFVGTRRYDDDLGVYTPADAESYLAFRYGDWETPVEEWSLTDDGAVQLRDPGPLFEAAESDLRPDLESVSPPGTNDSHSECPTSVVRER